MALTDLFKGATSSSVTGVPSPTQSVSASPSATDTPSYLKGFTDLGKQTGPMANSFMPGRQNIQDPSNPSFYSQWQVPDWYSSGISNMPNLQQGATPETGYVPYSPVSVDGKNYFLSPNAYGLNEGSQFVSPEVAAAQPGYVARLPTGYYLYDQPPTGTPTGVPSGEYQPGVSGKDITLQDVIGIAGTVGAPALAAVGAEFLPGLLGGGGAGAGGGMALAPGVAAEATGVGAGEMLGGAAGGVVGGGAGADLSTLGTAGAADAAAASDAGMLPAPVGAGADLGPLIAPTSDFGTSLGAPLGSIYSDPSTAGLAAGGAGLPDSYWGATAAEGSDVIADQPVAAGVVDTPNMGGAGYVPSTTTPDTVGFTNQEAAYGNLLGGNQPGLTAAPSGAGGINAGAPGGAGGLIGPNAAPAAASFGAPSGGGGGFWGNLGSFLGRNWAPLAGLGLTGALTGLRGTPGQKQLGPVANLSTGTATSLITNAEQGNLLPGQKAQLDQWQQQAEAQARQAVSTMMGGAPVSEANNSTLRGELANIRLQRMAMEGQFNQENLAQGLNALGLADTAESQLAELKLKQNAQIAQALAQALGVIGFTESLNARASMNNPTSNIPFQ